MDAAECLEDHESCVLDEVVETRDQEEVIVQHGLTLVQLQSSRLKVKVDVQVLQELSNRVLVRVRLLHHTDNNVTDKSYKISKVNTGFL